MIKQYYYSTLNDKLYDTKKAAQEAEDNYVDEYFKALSEKAAAKRRKLRQIARPIKHKI